MSIVDQINEIGAILKDVERQIAINALNRELRRKTEVYAVAEPHVVCQAIACVGFNAAEAR